MENALLYTFTTIAQTLGGAITLLSAFVPIRFQLLDALMDNESRRLDGYSAGLYDARDVYEFERMRAEGDYAGFLERLRTLGARSAPSFTRLKRAVSQRRQIVSSFKDAARMTGATALLSIGILPCAQIIKGNTGAAWFVLAAGVVLFGLCVFIYWLVISYAPGLREFREDRG